MKLKHLYLCSLFAAGSLLIASALYGQSPAPAAGGEGAKPAEQKKTLFDRIKEGGWVMWPIGACSVLTVYLIGDGVIRTSRKKTAPPEHEEALKNLFRAGDYVGAYNYCRDNPSPLTNVLRVGISLLGEGKQVTEDGMMGELAKENSQMQTWISYLSVIGVCTPMIGLLGTVTGMMNAFTVLHTSGVSGDPGQLSGAIGEVLIATASGLFIAIPAFGAFYFLRNRAADAVHHIQDAIAGLFRKMPYESLAGVHIGDEELFAATPNWLAGHGGSSEQHPAPAH